MQDDFSASACAEFQLLTIHLILNRRVTYCRNIALVVLHMLWDSMTYPKHWPTRTQHLDASVLASLTGMRVTHVEHDARYSNRNIEDVGAGGIGTSRAWLTLTVQDTNGDVRQEHVFVSLRFLWDLLQVSHTW